MRSVLICLPAFAAFLSDLINDHAKLVSSDLELDSEKGQLFSESRKTDNYKDVAWVVVVVSGIAIWSGLVR